MKNRNLLTNLLILISLFIVSTLNVKAQNIGINSTGATPNSSAMLDIDVSAMASKKGLLIPRITAAQKTAMNPLPEAAQGLIIFQTDGVQGLYYNTSTTTTPFWSYLAPSTSGNWSTTGNTSTDPAINFIGTLDNNDLVIKTNNYEVMRVTTNGKVGINESNPNASLQVKTYANGILTNPFDGLKIQSPYNTNYNRGTLLGIEDGSISGVMGQNAQLWNFEPGFLRFGTQNIERMRIDKDGLFGFNESDPVSTFTIRPYINGIGASYDGIRIIHPLFSSNTTNGLLLGVDISGNNATLTYFQTGDLNISANAGNMNFATNGFNQMKITSFGQVTIGNTNPLAVLTIQDNAGFQPGLMVTNIFLAPGTDGMFFGLNQGSQNNGKIWNYMSGDIEIGTNGTELIRLSNNGKVGIGITVPLEKLHVVGNTRISSLAGGTRMVQADVNGTLVALLEGTPSQVLLGNGAWGTVPGADNNWLLTGNSGINAATNFIGTIDVNDLVFKTNNSERVRIMSDGNVGIGTNNPLTNLHVVGITRISSLSGTGTRMVQADANGTLIPLAAGTASQVLLGTGVWGSVPAGNDWSLTGNAGTTPGTNFIGTTDNNDVVFKRGGIQAGLLNWTKSNTSWGINALNPATTGIANTAIGNRSLNSNTTGISNTSTGEGSLYANLDGDFNTANGSGSLFSNQNGDYNTANGDRSLFTNISGIKNTALGANSGFFSTGSNNIFVGVLSGENLTSGDKNIILGTDIDFPVSTGSNQLNIGNIIYGTGINGVNSTISTGNIGIATPTPLYKLDVNGTGRFSSTLTIGAYTLPATDGTSGQVLKTNGAGALTWQADAGAGSGWNLTGNAGTTAGTNYIGTNDVQDLVLKTNNTEWMRILSGGNVGIGITTPSQKLNVNGNIFAQNGEYKIFNNTMDLYRSSTGLYGSATGYDFNNVNTLSGIILEQGESESGGFYADGDMTGIWSPGDNDILKIWDEDGMALRARVDGGGNWYAVSNNATSDARLKKNIRPLNESLNKILALEGKLFDWKDEILFKGELEAGKQVPYEELKNKIGFMAQDLELVLPEVVSTNKITGYKAVNYEAIIPVVTEAIKEQQKMIEDLMKSNEDLKMIVAEQQKQINQILNH